MEKLKRIIVTGIFFGSIMCSVIFTLKMMILNPSFYFGLAIAISVGLSIFFIYLLRLQVKSFEQFEFDYRMIHQANIKKIEQVLDNKDKFLLDESISTMIRHAKFADLAYGTKKLDFNDVQKRNRWFKELRHESLEEALALLDRCDSQNMCSSDLLKIVEALTDNLRPKAVRDVVERRIEDGSLLESDCVYGKVLIAFAFRAEDLLQDLKKKTEVTEVTI